MDPVVERSVDLDATPDDVWRAITEPEELAAWFGQEAELDVQPGGLGRFVDDDGCVRRAVVDHVRAGERLVLRWWPEGDDSAAGASVVTFVVAPTGSGTRLIVTERLAATAAGVSAASVRAAAEAARTAWMWRLDVLLLRLAAVALV
jgi:uncharacterized protein YndB with AHSA1/START domain